MQTAVVLSNLLLIALVSSLEPALLRRLGYWTGRRDLPLFVLATPLATLGLGISELYHLIGRPCLWILTSWDELLAGALVLGVMLVALAGVSLGLFRLFLMAWVIARKSLLRDPALQAIANRLAGRRGMVAPRVWLCAYDRPLAFTSGLWRPGIILSTWMVEQLDRQELEAVLAHELAHVARRDYLVMWLAVILRDAFCYLPASWAAYRQLQQEKEIACDDRARSLTKRPLALASALAKVWQYRIEGTCLSTAQSLAGVNEAIDHRIQRLLDRSEVRSGRANSRLVTLSVGGLIPLLLAVVMLISGTCILALMGCHPLSWVGQVFS